MAAKNEVSFYRWDSMKKERVSDMLERRLITGDRMMLAHVYLKKGCIVPKHSHENEQLTYILEGALKFKIGEDGTEEIVVSAGEVLLIPSNVPHMAEALEETLGVDVFSATRQDWLDKESHYRRRSSWASVFAVRSRSYQPAAKDSAARLPRSLPLKEGISS